MNLKSTNAWPAAFEPIRADFGYSRSQDQEAASWLAQALARPPFATEMAVRGLAGAVAAKTVWVLGAANSARDDLAHVPPGALLWTADGATTAAREADRLPHAVVTDLDGNIEDEVEAARRGAFVVLHAHADNGEALRENLSRFPADRVLGTCQVEARPPLLNPGGFTDGDRAVHLALAMGAGRVRLAGFEWGGPPGRYSGTKNAATKARKLAWGRRLVDGLIADGRPVEYG